MEEGVSSAFSPEASDYLLPPSHKVIVLMDHGPRMNAKSNCPISITWKSVDKSTKEKKRTVVERNLWTIAIEATVETHRVVSDLFPDGDRLMRVVVADAVSRRLSTDWAKTLVTKPELLAQLSTTGAPAVASASGDTDCSFLSLGVQLAVETLSETTDKYTKMRHMDPKEQVALTKYLSHNFAWKIHPTKSAQKLVKYEKGMTLGKTTVKKTIVTPNGEEEEDKREVQRACYIMNKGSIFVLTRMKSDSEVSALEKEVSEAIATRNIVFKSAKDKKGTTTVDHVSLFILNLLPVGDKAEITSKPLTKINDLLSCGVRSCSVKGDELITGVHGILMPLYDLVSTTVTGIPMKEESNSSHSVNYDVELLHERLAHSELARNGLLKESMPKPPTYPIVMKSDDEKKKEEEKENEKKEGEPPKSPGLVSSLHDGAYSTVRLTWATPSPKTAWNMFPRSRSTYPVTPSYLNARPSICLTSFLGQGKSVMLEVKNPPLAPFLTVEKQAAGIAQRKERKRRALAAMPPARRAAAEKIVASRLAVRRKMRKIMAKYEDSDEIPAKGLEKKNKLLSKRRGTGLQPNLHGTRLISHTLIAHSGRIYIHEISLNGGAMKCEMARQSAGFKPAYDLRIADFRSLMREMMIAIPSKAKLLEYQDKKAKGLLPRMGPPNMEARERALRLTRYWPLKASHSFIYNIKQKMEPLFGLMRKSELSTADVDKCKQSIKKITDACDSVDLFTYSKFPCEILDDPSDRDEQLFMLFREITAHLINYAAHSERHTEVFTMWARASEEENAMALEPSQLADVNVATRFEYLFKSSISEEEDLRLNRMRHAGSITGGAVTAVATASGGGTGGSTGDKRDTDDCAKIRAPQRAIAIAMNVLRDREGGEPMSKRQRVLPKFQWTSGEYREIIHLLKVRQDPTMMVPRRDFVGREQADGDKAKLYPQLGDLADRGPKPIVG